MDTRQVLKAMTEEDKLALVCGVGNNSTFPIRVLPSLKFEPNGLFCGTGVRFPYPVAAACSWDDRVAYEIGCETGKQCCANGVHVTAKVPSPLPVSNATDGGRYRSFSTDPCLSRTLSSAFIDGVQSTGVGACMPLSEKRGILSAADRKLLAAALCGDGRSRCKPKAVAADGSGNDGNFVRSLGYEGCVVSSWGTVNDRAAAMNGGIDLSMPGSGTERDRLCDILEEGRLLSGDKLDKSAEKVLELIDETFDDHAYGLNRGEQLKKSVMLAAECAVLLKNDSILPLSGDRVTFVGISADRLPVSGEEGSPKKGVSLAEAFKTDRRVRVLSGDAEEILKQTLPDETVIVVFGEENGDCIGNERQRMLDENLLQTAEKLEDSDRNVIAVVAGGGEMDLSRIGVAKAILYAPYLGDGAATALKKIICGEISPCGRLAEDFFAKDKDGETRVLYPLGYGLTYGSFSYSEIRLKKSEGGEEVLLDIRNDGSYAAADTVQIYAEKADGERRLVAFEKVLLKAREIRPVSVKLPNRIEANELLVCQSKTDVIQRIPYDGAVHTEEKQPVTVSDRGTNDGSFRTSDTAKDIATTGGGRMILRRIKKAMSKAVGGDFKRAEKLTAAASEIPLGALNVLSDGRISKKALKVALLRANKKHLKAFAAMFAKY